MIGLGHGFNTEAHKDNIIETVDTFELFLSKSEMDRSVDATVVKGVVSYMVQSLIKSGQVLPARLEKAKHDLQQDDSKDSSDGQVCLQTHHVKNA